jgi:hypothetical protein
LAEFHQKNFSNASANRCAEVLSRGQGLEYAPRAESAPILNFYMGKNTPERKDYIMESLVVPVED